MGVEVGVVIEVELDVGLADETTIGVDETPIVLDGASWTRSVAVEDSAAVEDAGAGEAER